MSNESTRAERVSENLRREMSILLKQEAKDPRLQQLTVTDVQVSNDLSHAKIFVTTLDHSKKTELMKALERAKGYLRSQVGRRLQLRLVPEMVFEYDTTLEKGQHLTDLINKAVAEDEMRSSNDNHDNHDE